VKHFFVVLAGEAGIALLRLGEQTFFGGEESATAVDVDGAALEDDAMVVMEWQEEAVLEFCTGISFGDDGGVLFVIGIFGPAVENEMIVGDFACGIFDADGAGVAHPAAIGGDAEEIYIIEIGSGFFEDGADAFFCLLILDHEEDALDVGEVADDFREGPGNRSKFARPVGEFVGPTEPSGFVRFPFRGHVVAELEGRF